MLATMPGTSLKLISVICLADLQDRFPPPCTCPEQQHRKPSLWPPRQPMKAAATIFARAATAITRRSRNSSKLPSRTVIHLYQLPDLLKLMLPNTTWREASKRERRPELIYRLARCWTRILPGCGLLPQD